MGLLDSPWWLRTLPIPGCVHAWPENGPSIRRRNSNIPIGHRVVDQSHAIVGTPIPNHIDLAGNTSYHFAASRTVSPRVLPYPGPGPFAPFGSRI